MNMKTLLPNPVNNCDASNLNMHEVTHECGNAILISVLGMFFKRHVAVVSLLLLLLSVVGMGSAQAQNILQIVSPQGAAKIISNAGFPAVGSGWGYPGDNLLNVPAVTGQAVYLRADSATCNSVLPNLAGKIVIVYRQRPGTPTCFVREKLLRAQQAGAIGAVVINFENIPLNNTGGGTEGPLVTIPFSTVGLNYQDTLIPLANTGTLVIRVGSSLGLFPNDLVLDMDSVAVPPSQIRPGFTVRNPGDFRFIPGGQIKAFGSQITTNVRLRVTIRKNATPTTPAYQIYQDSAAIVSFPAVNNAGSKRDLFTAPFDLVTAIPDSNARNGLYTLTYSLATNEADSTPGNNVVTHTFGISERGYTKARVDAGTTEGNAISTNYYGARAGGGSLSGMTYITNNIPVTLGYLTFAITTNAADSLNGLTLNATVDEWNDLNTDSTIEDAELTNIGSGSFTYSANNQRQVPVQISMFDANFDPGVIMEPNKRYLMAVSYDGLTTIFIGSDEKVNYIKTVYRDSFDPIVAGKIGGNWYFPGRAPSLRGEFFRNKAQLLATSLREGLTKKGMQNLRIVPNPVSKASKVSVVVPAAIGTGKANLYVYDASGKVVSIQLVGLPATQIGSSIPFSTDGLDRGMYQVRIVNQTGSQTGAAVGRFVLE
jgi:hypothetical protein